MGIVYKNGEGVIKNLDEAVKYYRLAAKQGHKESKERLKTLGYAE